MSKDQHSVVAQASTVLCAAPLFAGLDPGILETLAVGATSHRYPGQAIVFFQGEHNPALFVVQEGWLKACKHAASGREHTIGTFGPGATLNDVAALAGVPTQATVTTLEPSIIWRIPQYQIMLTLDTYPPLARVLIGSLAGRVMHLANMVEDLALRSVEERLARLILTRAQNDQIERRHWATQTELAHQIGTVPEVLNRILRSMADAGLIAVDRRFIRILDHAALAQVAQLA